MSPNTGQHFLTEQTISRRPILTLDERFPKKGKKWENLTEEQCEKCNTMTFGICEECGKWICIECADLTQRCLEC